MKAKFSVECNEIGFSRSQEIPLDARGYCHQLAEDLSRAMLFYEIRVENHKLKQEVDALKIQLKNKETPVIKIMPPPAPTFMSRLYDSVKQLVKDGIYSIYRLEDGRLILFTPPSRFAYSIFTELTDEPKKNTAHIYSLDELGNVRMELPDNDLKNYKVKEFIHL